MRSRSIVVGFDDVPRVRDPVAASRLPELAVLSARTKLEALSDDDLAAIETVSDQRALIELITALGRASSILEARATLDRALAR